MAENQNQRAGLCPTPQLTDAELARLEERVAPGDCAVWPIHFEEGRRLLAEVRRLRARDTNARHLLRAIQWSGWDYRESDGTRTGLCPNCWADGWRGEHLPHCELGALLRSPAEDRPSEVTAGPLKQSDERSS